MFPCFTWRVLLKAKEGRKLFWAYVNRQQSSSRRPCFVDKSVPATQPATIAELFTTQFSSAYSPTISSPHPDRLTQELEAEIEAPAASITTLTLLPEHLQEAVHLIKSSQSPGPDHMAPAFLRLLYPHVLHFMLLMFQSFLDHAFNSWLMEASQRHSCT